MVIQIIFNGLWLLELVSDFILSGPIQAYRKQFRVWPETICQIFNLYITIEFLLDFEDRSRYNHFIKMYSVIIFIRILKLLSLLYEIRVMRIIIETAKNMISPLSSMFVVLMIIFYIFAYFGMLMFGGLVRRDLDPWPDCAPPTYHLMNFNDLLSSFITLWALMVVNNWYEIVDLMCTVKGGNTYYRLFFYLFYYASVIIGVNLFVAFVLDMYGAVERLEDEKSEAI